MKDRKHPKNSYNYKLDPLEVKARIDEMIENKKMQQNLVPTSLRDIAQEFKVTPEAIRKIYNKFYGKSKTNKQSK